MRRVLVVVAAVAGLVAGCGGGSSRGPAWPAPSTTADDGGESIEPRNTAVASSLEKSAEPDADDDKPADDAAKPAAVPADDKPAAATVPVPSTPIVDDVIISEEIIIEIED